MGPVTGGYALLAPVCNLSPRRGYKRKGGCGCDPRHRGAWSATAFAMSDLCKMAELAENTLAVFYVATFENALPHSHRSTNNQQHPFPRAPTLPPRNQQPATNNQQPATPLTPRSLSPTAQLTTNNQQLATSNISCWC